MSNFKPLVAAMALATSAVLMPAAFAQVAGQAGDNPSAVQPGDSAASMTDGEVRKIDKDSRKITLKHGDIKNLDMPGMTMVFGVKDAKLLDAVKVGDKVRFSADKSEGGSIVVTAIEAVR